LNEQCPNDEIENCWIIEGKCAHGSVCLTKDESEKCKSGCRHSTNDIASGCEIDSCGKQSATECGTNNDNCFAIEGRCSNSSECSFKREDEECHSGCKHSGDKADSPCTTDGCAQYTTEECVTDTTNKCWVIDGRCSNNSECSIKKEGKCRSGCKSSGSEGELSCVADVSRDKESNQSVPAFVWILVSVGLLLVLLVVVIIVIVLVKRRKKKKEVQQAAPSAEMEVVVKAPIITTGEEVEEKKEVIKVELEIPEVVEVVMDDDM
jgi:hypothetical protein